jgi:hypothetical protein
VVRTGSSMSWCRIMAAASAILLPGGGFPRSMGAASGGRRPRDGLRRLRSDRRPQRRRSAQPSLDRSIPIPPGQPAYLLHVDLTDNQYDSRYARASFRPYSLNIAATYSLAAPTQAASSPPPARWRAAMTSLIRIRHMAARERPRAGAPRARARIEARLAGYVRLQHDQPHPSPAVKSPAPRRRLRQEADRRSAARSSVYGSPTPAMVRERAATLAKTVSTIPPIPFAPSS